MFPTKTAAVETAVVAAEFQWPLSGSRWVAPAGTDYSRHAPFLQAGGNVQQMQCVQQERKKLEELRQWSSLYFHVVPWLVTCPWLVSAQATVLTVPQRQHGSTRKGVSSAMQLFHTSSQLLIAFSALAAREASRALHSSSTKLITMALVNWVETLKQQQSSSKGKKCSFKSNVCFKNSTNDKCESLRSASCLFTSTLESRFGYCAHPQREYSQLSLLKTLASGSTDTGKRR